MGAIAAVALFGVLAPSAQAASSCRPPEPEHAQIVSTPPPAALTSRLAVLRRPQSEADLPYVDRLIQRPFFFAAISTPFVRLLGPTADEVEVVLVPGRLWYPILPRRCLRGLPPRRRRAEERIRRNMIKRSREIRLTIWGFGPEGQGGWGAGAADAHGLVNNLTTATIGQPWGGSVVVGLAPDGVATIDFTFARKERRRAVVNNNLWSTVVPISAPRAFPLRTVWRAADGSVVKTFRDEPGR
jgi:hypothetical protein